MRFVPNLAFRKVSRFSYRWDWGLPTISVVSFSGRYALRRLKERSRSVNGRSKNVELRSN